MNVIVPLMGTGERFKAAGYAMPKPMINVAGKPMIERAIEPFLDRGCHFTFVLRPEYSGLKLPGRKLVLTENTQGAACTVLEGLKDLDLGEPLVILNSDQILNFSWLNFDTLVRHANPDGVIWVFRGQGKRWSYANVDPHTKEIFEVAEKEEISEWATCGCYYFSKGIFFKKAATAMIKYDERVNGEFYVAPIYNFFPNTKGTKKPKIFAFESGMHGLGTPEDLEAYLCTLG